MTDYRSAALALGITGLQEEQIDAIANCIRRHRAIARVEALREGRDMCREWCPGFCGDRMHELMREAEKDVK